MRIDINEKSGCLTSKRESSKLENEGISLCEAYIDNKGHEGEYLLQELYDHKDIYKYIKELSEKKEGNWKEEIAEFLGMADIIREKLIEELNLDILDSKVVWHCKMDHIKNSASPVQSQIINTIDYCFKLQETKLKLEAINDFIHFAEYACDYYNE